MRLRLCSWRWSAGDWRWMDLDAKGSGRVRWERDDGGLVWSSAVQITHRHEGLASQLLSSAAAAALSLGQLRA